MARKKNSGVNKAQAVRDYLAENPDAMPKTVSDELKKQGLDVAPQRVSIIKSNLKKDSGPGRGKGGAAAGTRTRRGGRKSTASVGAAADGGISYEALRKAKEMADQLGGLSRARSALEALAQLTG